MNDETKSRIAELLSAGEPDVRRRAAQELCEHRNLAVVSALAAALSDENKGVRDAVCQSLLAMGGENVARAIVEYIADENIVTRNLAGALLQRLDGDAVHVVLPYLQDASYDVRKYAVDLLGIIGSKATAKNIGPLLNDADENVVISAAEALGNLGNQDVVPGLLDAYARCPFTRAAVAEALGKIGGNEAADFLLGTLRTDRVGTAPDQLTLITCIDSLGAIGGEDALAELLRRMPDVRGKLRNMTLHAIVRILERIRGSASLPVPMTHEAREALNDSDPKVRASAARILARSDADGVTHALLEISGIDEELDTLLLSLLEVREDALEAVVGFLASHRFTSPSYGIRLAGRVTGRMLQRILARDPVIYDEALLSRAFEVVADEWHAADEETRVVLVDTLFHIDGDRTVGFLDTIVADADPWLRMRVIEQLAGIEDRRVPMFVRRFIADEDEMVREMAMTLLQSRAEIAGLSEGAQ
jgi:HEAT repeat protein